MDKQHIIDEIHRTAVDGKALGEQRFHNETGIIKRDWYSHYWLRWGDVIKKAGFPPNEFTKGDEIELLIEQFISLIREKNEFPIEGQVQRRKKRDNKFPSSSTFRNRLGKKAELAAKVIAYCRENSGYEDIITICEPIALAGNKDKAGAESESVDFGYVYLMKSGRYYTIGKANHTGRRQYEHERKLPKKIKTIHTIKTDDPFEIEKYWHNRFKEKRTETDGSWYDLDANDVKAFKRWKRIF